jgi:hypothetical protein
MGVSRTGLNAETIDIPKKERKNKIVSDLR